MTKKITDGTYMKVALFMLLTFCFAPTLSAESSRKSNIAVSDFKNETGNKNNDIYSRFTSELLLDLFLKTKRFDVISRDTMNKILKEKALDQTGITDASDVQQLKTLLHADHLVFGKLLQVSVIREKSRYIAGKPAKTKRKATARDPVTNQVTRWETKIVRKAVPGRTVYPVSFSVTLSAKLVDVGTSEILSSEQGKSSATVNYSSSEEASKIIQDPGSHIHRRIQKASVTLIMNFVKNIPIIGTVVRVSGSDEIIIDLGMENGLFAKTNLMVYTTESLSSSDYGRGLEKVNIDKEIAILRVTKIDADISYAKVTDGDVGNIKKGMRVKIIPPRFELTYLVPSVIVPGLGQMLAGNVWRGVGFLVFTGAPLGFGAAMLWAGLFAPVTKNLLDSAVGSVGTGRVESELLSAQNYIAYGLIAVGGLLYLWNLNDAGYPAQKNPAFEGNLVSYLKRGDVIPIFYQEINRHGPRLLASQNSAFGNYQGGASNVNYRFGVKMVF